jgi:ABC-type amino acid transport substrate-binding protein
MRKSFVLLVVCLLFLNMSRNSGSAAETENITAIRVATSPGYAPFEFLDDDKLVGYEVDVVKELEQRTGIKVNWEYADFSGLLGLLDSKRADMIAAQFSPTKERKQKYDFSDPINYYTKVIVVADNNNDIKGIDDLAGKQSGNGFRRQR